MNIVVLSKDFELFKALITSQLSDQAPEKYTLICATDAPQDIPFGQTQILLADPKLANQIIQKCENLVWVQSTWAGVNALISNEKKNYHLTGLKNVFGAKMSEYVFAYLLYFSRNVAAFQNLQKQRLWRQAEFDSLSGKTLGIMGLGNIGQAVAKTAIAFGMQIHGLSRNSTVAEASRTYKPEELLDFASSCDYIVNLLPETSQTVGLCKQDFFENMKPTAIFINAGRGGVIDSAQTLVDALDNKQLRAAVIDVCEEEPLPKDHLFWQTDKLILTNHTAALSSAEDVFDVFKQNLELYSQEQPLNYVVDKNKGY